MRDFKSYFTAPMGYVFITAYLAIMGWMFHGLLAEFNSRNMQYQQFNMGQAISITQGILQPLFGNTNVVALLMIPFITMRLFAEERKNNTLELLMTSPVTLTQIILGKFFSSVLFIIVLLTLTLVYPAILFATGNPEWGPIFTNYLGTFLMFCCLISVGIFCSATTENQIIAAAMTFAITFFFWLIRWGAASAGPEWGEVLRYLSMIDHYVQDMSKGVISSVDLVYYVSFIGIFLFLTHRVLDSYRWRG